MIIASHLVETIDDLFTGRTFVVPNHKISNSWTYSEFFDLFDDILDCAKKKDAKHFLGTLTIVKKNKKYLVADGEERLIALIMMLRAIEIVEDNLLELSEKIELEFTDKCYEYVYSLSEFYDVFLLSLANSSSIFNKKYILNLKVNENIHFLKMLYSGSSPDNSSGSCLIHERNFALCIAMMYLLNHTKQLDLFKIALSEKVNMVLIESNDISDTNLIANIHYNRGIPANDLTKSFYYLQSLFNLKKASEEEKDVVQTISDTLNELSSSINEDLANRYEMQVNLLKAIAIIYNNESYEDTFLDYLQRNFRYESLPHGISMSDLVGGYCYLVCGILDSLHQLEHPSINMKLDQLLTHPSLAYISLILSIVGDKWFKDDEKRILLNLIDIIDLGDILNNPAVNEEVKDDIESLASSNYGVSMVVDTGLLKDYYNLPRFDDMKDEIKRIYRKIAVFKNADSIE